MPKTSKSHNFTTTPTTISQTTTTALPIHPCKAKPSPLLPVHTNDGATFTLKDIFVNELPPDYPYALDAPKPNRTRIPIPYFEIRGRGSPDEILATSAGDVYVDVEGHELWLHTGEERGWEKWPGPQAGASGSVDRGRLLEHPHVPERYLWCTGEHVSWLAVNTIEIGRRAMRMGGLFAPPPPSSFSSSSSSTDKNDSTANADEFESIVARRVVSAMISHENGDEAPAIPITPAKKRGSVSTFSTKAAVAEGPPSVDKGKRRALPLSHGHSSSSAKVVGAAAAVENRRSARQAAIDSPDASLRDTEENDGEDEDQIESDKAEEEVEGGGANKAGGTRKRKPSQRVLDRAGVRPGANGTSTTAPPASKKPRLSGGTTATGASGSASASKPTVKFREPPLPERRRPTSPMPPLPPSKLSTSGIPTKTTARNSLLSLTDSVTKRDDTISARDATIQRREETIQVLHATISARDATIERQNEEIGSLREKLSA